MVSLHHLTIAGNWHYFVRAEVLVVVTMKITDECDVKLCCLVEVYLLLVDCARVAILVFLKPNSRNLDFLKFGWRNKILLPFCPFPGFFLC